MPEFEKIQIFTLAKQFYYSNWTNNLRRRSQRKVHQPWIILGYNVIISQFLSEVNKNDLLQRKNVLLNNKIYF